MSNNRVTFPEDVTELRQILLCDRIPIEELIGDHRNPNNPSYYLYGLMRSLRLGSFFENLQVGKCFENWRYAVLTQIKFHCNKQDI